MKIRVNSYVVIAIMIIALVVILSSLGMKHWKCKLLPLVLSGTIFILGAIELRKEILAGDEATATIMEEATSETRESRKILHGYLLTGAWVIGFLLAIYLLGFIIAIPLFTLSYMKLHDTTWLVAIISTILVLGFMYVMSEPLAGIQLYRGLLPPYLGELIY